MPNSISRLYYAIISGFEQYFCLIKQKYL